MCHNNMKEKGRFQVLDEKKLLSSQQCVNGKKLGWCFFLTLMRAMVMDTQLFPVSTHSTHSVPTG